MHLEMRLLSLTIQSALALIVAVSSATAQDLAKPVSLPPTQLALGGPTHTNLLLVGDSITEGFLSPPGFRDDLHTLLSAVPGHTYSFLGSSGTAPLNGHFLGGREANHFYPASFGNGWGWGTFDITSQMSPVTPDLICVHLGTNDLDFGYPPYAPYSADHGHTLIPGQAGHFAEAVEYFLQWGNGTLSTELKSVVLSKIVPMQNRQTDVEAFNDAIVAFSEDLAEGVVTGTPVRVAIADHYSHFMTNPNLFTFGAGDWMADWVHPTHEGYTEMAQVFFEAIEGATSDFTSPAPILDLSIVSVTDTSVTLTFTSTGDDGDIGTAAGYDVRVGTQSIDTRSFGRTRQVTGEPQPAVAGTPETVVVEGLLSGTVYEFAVKATDESGNRSRLSKIVTGATSGSSTSIITLRADLGGCSKVADNTLHSSAVTANAGADESLDSGLFGAGDIRRGLLRFDLSFLPEDVQIVDARLQLYNHASESASPSDVGLYRLTKRWVQGNQGLAPLQGTSCWNAPLWGTLYWAVAGADQASDTAKNDDLSFDRHATPEDTIQLTATDAWYEWNVTHAVAQWVHRDWNNEGLLIKADAEVVGSGRSFHSSEYALDPTLRPTLVLTVQTAGE